MEYSSLSIRLKLASLWASFMFLYLYVDYFHLYMPGSMEDILAGKVFIFEITDTFLLFGMASVTIPTLMISLSVVLPARASRWTNIAASALYIPYSLFNLAGEAWLHMYFGAAVEIVLLGLIIHHAWKWSDIKKCIVNFATPSSI